MHLLSEKMKRHKNTAETINLDLIKEVGGDIQLGLFEPYTTYLPNYYKSRVIFCPFYAVIQH